MPPRPSAVYGVVLDGCAIAWYLADADRARKAGRRAPRALGADWKGKLSLAGYIAAIPLAFVSSWISIAIYVAIAAIWLIPDRRIERTLTR